MLTDTETKFVHCLSAKEVAKHNEFLTSVGPRYVAAEGEIKVMDYAAEKFTEYSLEVLFDEFKALAFEPKGVELKVTAPMEMELEAGAIFFSEPTPGLTGEVVTVDNGDEADYEGVDVSGKIALVETDVNSPKGALYQDISRAAKHGAKAIVFVHFEPRWLKSWSLTMTPTSSRSRARSWNPKATRLLPRATRRRHYRRCAMISRIWCCWT